VVESAQGRTFPAEPQPVLDRRLTDTLTNER
jgi:hypothetical protein